MLLTPSSTEFLDLARTTLNHRRQPFRFRATGTSMEPFIRSGDILERRGRRVRLDRGAQRAMRWPGARIPIGRRISRTLGGWGTAIRERLDRDGGDLLRVVSLCGPSVRVDGLLPESEPEWEDVVSVAVTRDLAPLLYFQFQRSGTELPLEVSRALSRAYYGSAARYVVMINAFGEVLKAITDAGILPSTGARDDERPLPDARGSIARRTGR